MPARGEGVFSMDRPAHGATVAETHVSYVFFVGDRAYKLKKPVSFAFLDFSTREAREEACRREVELNRRLAPDVYLGVATIVGPNGAPCDHLVVMRRMPEDKRLSALVAGGVDVAGHLREISRAMAAFHARAETSDAIAAAGLRDAVAATWDENFAEMRPFVGSILPAEEFQRVEDLAHRYLAGRERLFAQRVARGGVRDGHGDLLADDIFCLDDGPRILDCIEFDDRFRWADVVADIAFLAMDLARLGRHDLADGLVRTYREFSGDPFSASLADHYVAYRAIVRSKVACLRADQGDAGAADEAVRLLRLAGERLVRGRAVMLLVGGLPGTGKSTLALGVADARGWSLIRSDEVRKDLAGIPHADRARAPYGEGIYTPAATAATYEEMLVRAARALEMGESVVLDATWSDRRLRDAATAAAVATHADLVQFRCVAPADVAVERLRVRNRAAGDVSDATPEIAREMFLRSDAWPDARRIDTTRAADYVLHDALATIDAAFLRRAVRPYREGAVGT